MVFMNLAVKHVLVLPLAWMVKLWCIDRQSTVDTHADFVYMATWYVTELSETACGEPIGDTHW